MANDEEDNKKTFSERVGITQRRQIQRRSLNTQTRNRLWTVLSDCYWRQADRELIAECNNRFSNLIRKLWTEYFKFPSDTLKQYWEFAYKDVRQYFFDCKWNEAFDFLEFIVQKYDDAGPVTRYLVGSGVYGRSGYTVRPNDETRNLKFMSACNEILKEERSDCRFIIESKTITEITSEGEITGINDALKVTNSSESLRYVHLQLDKALKLLSDRESTHYSNSIKESISAVGTLCKLVAGTANKKVTLPQALDFIENKHQIKIAPALRVAVEKLYGYSNVEEGIRHELMSEPTLDYEDALFMYVACSAFVSYIVVKARKSEIPLD